MSATPSASHVPRSRPDRPPRVKGRHALLLGAGIGLFGVLWLQPDWLSHETPGAHTGPVRPTLPRHPAASPARAAILEGVQSPADAPVWSQAETSPEKARALRPLRPELLRTHRDRLRADLLEQYPALKQARALRRRVLPDDQSLAEQQALLMDLDVLDAAAHSLSQTPAAFDETLQLKHMEEISLLGDALQWEENPSRPEVFAAITQAIQADNLNGQLSLELRRSIAGDKWELFQLLLSADPLLAQDVLLAAEGTPSAGVLEYALLRYQDWTQKEG